MGVMMVSPRRLVAVVALGAAWCFAAAWELEARCGQDEASGCVLAEAREEGELPGAEDGEEGLSLRQLRGEARLATEALVIEAASARIVPGLRLLLGPRPAVERLVRLTGAGEVAVSPRQQAGAPRENSAGMLAHAFDCERVPMLPPLTLLLGGGQRMELRSEEYTVRIGDRCVLAAVGLDVPEDAGTKWVVGDFGRSISPALLQWGTPWDDWWNDAKDVAENATKKVNQAIDSNPTTKQIKEGVAKAAQDAQDAAANTTKQVNQAIDSNPTTKQIKDGVAKAAQGAQDAAANATKQVNQAIDSNPATRQIKEGVARAAQGAQEAAENATQTVKHAIGTTNIRATFGDASTQVQDAASQARENAQEAQERLQNMTSQAQEQIRALPDMVKSHRCGICQKSTMVGAAAGCHAACAATGLAILCAPACVAIEQEACEGNPNYQACSKSLCNYLTLCDNGTETK
eukprot:CAMPEP_0203862050 /NCGR_PEP_ID=MMETSP0359-20131031/13366_1 /ASSEMBLY_ACC=CAM_ASM_000338 /TAXON_ID=268821 /ORGANISM="Scrippsiella Hangoei, Strain SHTV-5" /LENGTH=460 /DNA_ID=CAMNT_0050779383 /DNA_START=62 /DNA_END=1444 /DNA_ORIENTATION=+